MMRPILYLERDSMSFGKRRGFGVTLRYLNDRHGRYLDVHIMLWRVFCIHTVLGRK